MALMGEDAKLRGIAVDSKKDFEETNAYVEEKNVKCDVMLDRMFAVGDAKKVFDLQLSGNFLCRIVFKIVE